MKKATNTNSSIKLTQDVLLPDVSSYITYSLSWSVYNAGICFGCKEKYSGCMYKVTNYKFLCPFCHIIKYLNLANIATFNLYYSTLSQIEIIKKTKEFYNVNKKIPKPNEIDTQVLKSCLSLTEFIYLLKDPAKKQNAQMSNHKIFFNNKLPTGFLSINNDSFFDSDEDNSEDEEMYVNNNKNNDNINNGDNDDNDDNDDDDNYDSGDENKNEEEINIPLQIPTEKYRNYLINALQ